MDSEEEEDDEESARVRRFAASAQRAAAPHRPKNLEFEDRGTHLGTVIAIRDGLDNIVPLAGAVPDSCRALCVPQIHGRVLAMLDAGWRPFMQKARMQHKKVRTDLVVCVSGAQQRFDLKSNVHSLKQYWRCRDLPADAVLQDMTVPMLKKVCEAVGGVDQYKSLKKAPLLQAVKARLADLRLGASTAQVRSQPLDVPARRATPRCAACDALTTPPATNRVPFWLGETFSDSIARMPSNTRARTMIECLMKQCTAVCSATWDQGRPDRSSTPRNFMSPATTASKVSWHLAALTIACSIISIQRRVSTSSQLVPNPVDHVKSFSSG